DAAPLASQRLYPAAGAELMGDFHQMRLGNVIGGRHLRNGAQAIGLPAEIHQQTESVVRHVRQPHRYSFRCASVSASALSSLSPSKGVVRATALRSAPNRSGVTAA